MNPRDAWRDAFPAESAKKVVAYVIDTWNDLAARRLPAFSWSEREPTLTLTLKDMLKDNSRAAGLGKGWGGEDAFQRLDKTTLKRIKGFRTDITYHSNRDYPRELLLTFEWKKLKAGSSSNRAYYGSSGMGRFLEPEGYAKDEPFGVMVGIVESPEHLSIVQGLKRALGKEDVLGLLHVVPNADGQHLRAPSREMPGLADFDTEHVRHSGGFETFMFTHVFVTFPG